MLEKTVAALVELDYPHDTWVLDEGDDVAVYQLCQRLGARHFSRFAWARYRQSGGPFKSHTKYGNYNAWLEEFGYKSYDLILAVDADHVLQRDYLTRVLGYFDDDNVAYVQPAQAYYNQKASFIARAAAEETYAYYSAVQMAAYGVGYPILVGCHNVHRVAALRDIGGFAAHEADDLVMTLLYRSEGWRGVYVAEILARGLTPVSWLAYLRQQRRWARSVLDFKMRVFPRYGAKLPLLERILTYVHGVSYLRGPIVAVQLAILCTMLATGSMPRGSGSGFLLGLGALWLTLLLGELYRQRFFPDVRNEAALHWRARFVAFVKWPYFMLAFWDAIRGEYGNYTLTPKARRSPKALGFGTVHVVVGIVVALAWLTNVLRGPSEFIALHLAVGLAILASLAAAMTSAWRFPVPFPSARRRSWMAEVELARKVAVEAVPLMAASQRHVRRVDIPRTDWDDAARAS